MVYINNYEGNIHFRKLYSSINDHFDLLQDFAKHMQEYITLAESKIGSGLKLYSSDFFEYYNAGSYGETFRGSFIVTVSSVSEIFIKDFINTWKKLSREETLEFKNQNGIIDYLKAADKKYFQLGLDYSKPEVSDFQGLLAIRNSIVHSSGTFEYVEKYVPQISQLARKYPSIVIEDEQIVTTVQLCYDALSISKKFFFYIFKKAIQKFPIFRRERPLDEDFFN